MTHDTHSQPGPTCSNCQSSDVIPVIYGLPTPDTVAAADRGDVALGGCASDGGESWRCRNCDTTTTRVARPSFFAVWEPWTTPEEIADWLETTHLDPAGGSPDDGQERNWDGQTREEYLDTLQDAHDDGAVMIDDGVWRVWDDAVTDLGVDRATELRQEMADYLTRAWKELGSS